MLQIKPDLKKLGFLVLKTTHVTIDIKLMKFKLILL